MILAGGQPGQRNRKRLARNIGVGHHPGDVREGLTAVVNPVIGHILLGPLVVAGPGERHVPAIRRTRRRQLTDRGWVRRHRYHHTHLARHDLLVGRGRLPAHKNRGLPRHDFPGHEVGGAKINGGDEIPVGVHRNHREEKVLAGGEAGEGDGKGLPGDVGQRGHARHIGERLRAGVNGVVTHILLHPLVVARPGKCVCPAPRNCCHTQLGDGRGRVGAGHHHADLARDNFRIEGGRIPAHKDPDFDRDLARDDLPGQQGRILRSSAERGGKPHRRQQPC